jgi:hypothetical protein
MGNRSSSGNAEEGGDTGSPPPEDVSEEQQMSYWQMMKQGYQVRNIRSEFLSDILFRNS